MPATPGASYDLDMPSPRTASLALLIGRVPIGIYFLIAGYNKIAGTGVQAFVEGASSRAPAWGGPMVNSYLYVLPFAECLFGLLVVIGLVARTSALFLSLMLASFLMAVAEPAYVHNLVGQKPGIPFDRNWLLLSGTVALALLGPGTASLDHLLHSRRRRAAVKT